MKTRKPRQLGELVIATGADALTADELAGALIVLAERKEAGKREARAKRGAAFFQSRVRRTAPPTERHTGGARAQPAAGNRQQGARARHDMRSWQVERRKGTRHLIELGGLVVKSGIVDLTANDRATIFGALLWMADRLEADMRERCGPRRESKRSRRTRRRTLGQIQLCQQVAVDARQQHISRALSAAIMAECRFPRLLQIVQPRLIKGSWILDRKLPVERVH